MRTNIAKFESDIQSVNLLIIGKPLPQAIHLSPAAVKPGKVA